MNDLFWRNEMTLTDCYGGSPADYAAALELIQAGKIRVRGMITHRLGLAEKVHFHLSLRVPIYRDVAISPGSRLSKSDYRAAEVAAFSPKHMKVTHLSELDQLVQREP